MSGATLRKYLAVATAAQLALAGCSTPDRLPAVPTASELRTTQGLGPIRFLVSRETGSFAAEAQSALAKEKAWLASQGKGPQFPTAYFLAISGGGDNGAFGSGVLNGWTASGTRPEFKVVTGVSTGALIAPFAFMGPKYDYVRQEGLYDHRAEEHFQEAPYHALLSG